MYGQIAGAETLTGNIWRQTPPGTPTNQPDGNLSVSIASIGTTGFVVSNIRGSLSGPSLRLSFASPALAQSAVDNRWSLLTIQGTKVGQPVGHFFVTSVRLATSGAVAQVVPYRQGGVTSTDRPRTTAPRVTAEPPTTEFTPPPPEDDADDVYERIEEAAPVVQFPKPRGFPTSPTAPAVTPTVAVKPAAAPAAAPAALAALGDVPWWMFAAAAAAFVMLRR